MLLPSHLLTNPSQVWIKCTITLFCQKFPLNHSLFSVHHVYADTQTLLTAVSDDNDVILSLTAMLLRSAPVATARWPRVLLQWSRWPVELSTWEDEAALRQQFPRAPAWGQDGSEGGREVTTQVQDTNQKMQIVAESPREEKTRARA
jgi:hypothetical protein